jgi:hypothetical protein
MGKWGELLVPTKNSFWDMIERSLYVIECLIYFYLENLGFLIERLIKASNVPLKHRTFDVPY